MFVTVMGLTSTSIGSSKLRLGCFLVSLGHSFLKMR
jgi:hypothetical protein